MILLSKFVIAHRRRILPFFAIVSIICAVLFFMTPTNYNMMDYLPEEANSTESLKVMEKEFSQPIPNLNVMIKDVSIPEALKDKKILDNTEAVEEVIWLDEVTDLKKPLELEDKKTVETYYKNNNALYMVTVEDGKERAAINAIRNRFGNSCVVSGTAEEQATSQNLAFSETMKSICFLVPILILILILATQSWIEPLFYLLTLAASVLINLGTNYFLGSISFVTLAAAPLLQLAVSLDYAVFLSHSFREFKETGMGPKEAVTSALLKSGKSISASMLTTFFGFLALVFMNFKIGFDLGLCLVKGILLSYLCVMILMPALLVCGNKLIDKTRHRRFLPEFSTIGDKIVKVRIPIFLILVIVIVPAYLGQQNNNFFYGNNASTPAESGAWEIERDFGINNSLVLLVPKGDSAKEALLCEDLDKLEHVTSVVSYASIVSNKVPEAYLDDEILSTFYSDNYARIVLSADLPTESDDSFALVKDVRKIADKYYPNACYTCGQSANIYDMMITVKKDNRVVSLITILSIYLVLLLMTRNLLTPVLLIFTIKCSIWLNMCVPYFMGDQLSYLGYLIVSAVQMGATVDYAILLTNTYQDKRLHLPKMQAIKEALHSSFNSILVSAATLTFSGFCLMWASTNSVVQILGELIGRGALLAIVMVMLLLPLLLLITDGILPHTKLPLPEKKRRKEAICDE